MVVLTLTVGGLSVQTSQIIEPITKSDPLTSQFLTIPSFILFKPSIEPPKPFRLESIAPSNTALLRPVFVQLAQTATDGNRSFLVYQRVIENLRKSGRSFLIVIGVLILGFIFLAVAIRAGDCDPR